MSPFFLLFICFKGNQNRGKVGLLLFFTFLYSAYWDMISGVGPISTPLTPFCPLLNARLWTGQIAAQNPADFVQIFSSQQQIPQRHMGSIALTLNPGSLLLACLPVSAKSARGCQLEEFNPTKARAQYCMGTSVVKYIFFFFFFPPFLWPSREVRPYSDDGVTQKVILQCQDCSCHWFPGLLGDPDGKVHCWHWGRSREDIRERAAAEEQRCVEGRGESITPSTFHPSLRMCVHTCHCRRE